MKWFKKTESQEKPEPRDQAPEKLRHSRYYEHDGALRAYANRAMVLAFLCVPTTFIAIALAAYVRLQPPTVIRVDSAGQAFPLSDKPPGAAVNVAQVASSAPTEFEKAAFVRLFLQHYLNFSPDSVNRNWADALNMMTANLRRSTMAALEKDNIVGKIQDDQITSVFLPFNRRVLHVPQQHYPLRSALRSNRANDSAAFGHIYLVSSVIYMTDPSERV